MRVVKIALALTFPVVAVSANALAAPRRPGPSLRVFVYDKKTQNPLHGAAVRLSDASGFMDRIRKAENTTDRTGVAFFPSRAFRYWPIERGKVYGGDDPWDWVSTPRRISGVAEGRRNGEDYKKVTYDPPVMARFKVKIEVTLDGFEPAARIVEILGPRAETAFYLAGKGGKSTGGKLITPPGTSGKHVMRAAEGAFALKKHPDLTINWPNGLPAVKADVGHYGVVQDEKPNGYGLWLHLFVFNEEGRGNAFSGGRHILLGHPETGLSPLTKGKWYGIDCGDIVVQFRLRSLDWVEPKKAGWTGSFAGTIEVVARMGEGVSAAGDTALPPAAPGPEVAPQRVPFDAGGWEAGDLRSLNREVRHLRARVSLLEALLAKHSIPVPPSTPQRKGREKIIDLGHGVTMRLVLIPAGQFVMGSPETEKGRSSDEGPQRRVTLTRAFYMGITEVTQDQYAAVIGKNPSKFRGPKNPVESVSWEDAVAFCEALSKKAGVSVRLPTEAQWEYACRAGTTSAWSCGNDPEAVGSYAWQSGNSDWHTHAVAQKKPNAWGLYDMHGNVWEWCHDWHDSDHYGKVGHAVDPRGPASGRYRVLRGGSWRSDDGSCRSALRYGCDPGDRNHGSGFRVVVSLGSGVD